MEPKTKSIYTRRQAQGHKTTKEIKILRLGTDLSHSRATTKSGRELSKTEQHNGVCENLRILLMSSKLTK